MEPDQQPNPIATRLNDVRARIALACQKVGRRPSSVLLVAVSKGQPADAIAHARGAGQLDFGENYAQELVAKARASSDLAGLRWHAIGRLQRNKARDVVRLATLVHSVDRIDLARELDRRAGEIGKRLDVLVEVNIAGEASKGGCPKDRLGETLAAIAGCSNLAARGLMTVPPDDQGARAHFAALRELRDAHGGESALPELSMGMSHDFEDAIAEGATIVRVGTAIFGPRPARGT